MTRPPEERFWSKVQRTDTCWLWTGARSGQGYGYFGFGTRLIKPRMMYAHRAAWAFTHGRVPDGLLVCHKCDVRLCVRPDHLFVGTYADNARDCSRKGRQNPARGERHGKAKLTEQLVREIRRRFSTGELNVAHLARLVGVSKPTLYLVIHGKRWAHVKDESCAL